MSSDLEIYRMRLMNLYQAGRFADSVCSKLSRPHLDRLDNGRLRVVLMP